MTESQVRNAWYQFVRTNTDVSFTVVWAEQLTGVGAPRPPVPFLTLKLIAGPTAVGQDELRYRPESAPAAGDDGYNLDGIDRGTISIQSFGSGGSDALQKLMRVLDNPILAGQLKQLADIAITDRGGVQNITALMDTGYESRHALDVQFTSSSSIDSGIEPIESAEVSGSIEGGQNNSIEVPDFEIPEA